MKISPGYYSAGGRPLGEMRRRSESLDDVETLIVPSSHPTDKGRFCGMDILPVKGTPHGQDGRATMRNLFSTAC